MKRSLMLLAAALCSTALFAQAPTQPPLGLPELKIPENNPQTPEKIALGEKLFKDKRFSSTGTVSCATCHAPEKAFTDETGPLLVSLGIDGLTGTRNAPTVINSAYNRTQFWDGRSPDLEDQAQHPFLNPVEMGLANHDPIIDVVRNDRDYSRAFNRVFGVSGDEITIEHVKMAIASFERTAIAGNSPFDRWYFAGEENAIGEEAKRGFDVFRKQGRCISCHAIEQDHALFTDHKFHNIGIGISQIDSRVPQLAGAFIEAKANGADVDVTVLTDADTSHLGRFAVTEEFGDVGQFKTPTLRNIAVTAPYMHDGSLATLRDVVVHYNNGGVSNPTDPVTPYLSGGIRPLNLTEQQIDDLVAFMETLTSPEFAAAAGAQ
jgi:cytochrome c peroxidase